MRNGLWDVDLLRQFPTYVKWSSIEIQAVLWVFPSYANKYSALTQLRTPFLSMS